MVVVLYLGLEAGSLVNNMKKLLFYIFFLFIFFSTESAFAQAAAPSSGGPVIINPVNCITMPNQVVSPQDAVALVGNCMPVNLEVNKTTYFRLCEIRRLFCGKIKTVMIATSVFIMGLLILTGKAKWTHALILATGVVIFSSAEWVTIQLTTFPPNFGVVWSCFCIDDWTNTFSNFTRLFTF